MLLAMYQWMLDNAVIFWFLLGLGLFLFEFTAPGLVLLFFGVGAWVAGMAAWLGLADSFTLQLTIFSVASVLFLITLRRYVKVWFVGDSAAEEDEFETEFLRQVVMVTRKIPQGNGQGKVELKGADWNAVSSDGSEIEKGERVKVKSRDGLLLTVERLSN